jgi:hypothetical protein
MVLAEPFFAEVIGTALTAPNTPCQVVEQLRESNPLALVYALKLFREPTAEIHHAVLHAIDTWLTTNNTHGRASRAIRWAALQVLATISEEARKRIDTVSVGILPFSAGEGRAAVQRRARR